MVKVKQKIIKLIPDETIFRKIYIIRDHKVMLDFDLAQLYEVETSYLKRQVRRNSDRFPADFMFELKSSELKNLRSQFGTSSWGGTRYMPMAFTEQGVAMLSGVINSGKAIKMNVAIMRAFVEIRRAVLNNNNVADKLKSLEERLGGHDAQLNQIYKAIQNLVGKKMEEEKWQERRRIGFKQK